MGKFITSKKIVTPEFRVGFEKIWEPMIDEKNGKKKWSLVMLFDKNQDLSEIKGIVDDVIKDAFPDVAPMQLDLPLRDGDTKQYESHKGKIYVNAKSWSPVGIVDAQRQPILDPSEFYSGCYARASITAYAWNHTGRKGVSISLQNLQKLKDGEPFSGRTAAEDDFTAITPSSDEVLSI